MTFDYTTFRESLYDPSLDNFFSFYRDFSTGNKATVTTYTLRIGGRIFMMDIIRLLEAVKAGS